MHLITRNTDYAVRALCFISTHKERFASVTELVYELGIPKPFLRRLLQTLTKSGFLKSYKGLGGGFELLLPPDKIPVIDIMEIFQGAFSINKCFFKKGLCPDRKSCLLKTKIDAIEKSVMTQLRAITLKDLIEKEK